MADNRVPNRVQTTVRFRRPTFLSMETLRTLLGGLSREDVLQLLLVRGLTAEYAMLGIDKDPAKAAGELLAALARAWGGDLSEEEAAAFRTVAVALERIAQVSARDGEGGPG